ncbi:MAG: toll/interleukin-1 receptor domain-containing protein [Bacteroidaceae bacterium]|nr:toll/interleukin-1 receptor domain-containing protein [Bacteroidaceae bacterium]
MSKTNYDVFVSYRRLDEQGNISGRDQARLIAKQLQLEGYSAFFDYSEIRDDEFDIVIIPAVERCKVFILVLTKDALNRCSNDDDWVRKEIETAIASGCKIVSVTPDNTFNGWPSNLPGSLDGIKKIQISDIQFGQLFEVSIKKLIEDRIESVITRRDVLHPTDSLLSQFYSLANNLYSLTIKYRDSINQGENVDNDCFMQMQDLVKKVYSLSDICRVNDKQLFEKSKSIVDQYNVFIEALKRQFSSKRELEDYNSYAAKSSEAFTNFVDVVVKVIDFLQIMEVRNKLTNLAFKYDKCIETSSDESLSFDERKHAFLDSAATIGEIVQLYRETRLMYPDSVRTVLDDKLNQCNEKSDDDLLKVIVFVQSFNVAVNKLLW